MSFSIIIPARYRSTRLPGKPLLSIAGKAMLQHVYERSIKTSAKQVIIATDDARIKSAAESFGASCLMTSDQHTTGTDRLSEVVDLLNLDDGEVIVNVQGDEPEIPCAAIEQVAGNLLTNPGFSIATLGTPVDALDEFEDENVVKVVKDRHGRALYFSRAPIPWKRADTGKRDLMQCLEKKSCLRHIGLYAYTASFLRGFRQWDVCELERIERLEQLRAMWHGHSIHIDIACEVPPPGIDTEDDLSRLRQQWSTENK